MKKLLIFLTITIPLFIILIVNLTVDVFLGDVYTPVERIELSETEIEAKVDDSVVLGYTLYPSNATSQDVIWQSDDESVAVVDAQGKVDFVSFGSGYITAITQDGKRASCHYIVTDDKVHRVELSAPSSEIPIGEALQLDFDVLPHEALNRAVKFESSNNEVAEVDPNGRVTAKSIGSTKITVTTVDGGFTNSLELFVVVPVSDIVVDTKDIVLASSTYQVRCSVLPENATNKTLKYEIDDPQIAEVNNFGLISFKKAGNCRLTITSVSGQISKKINFIYTGGYAYLLEVSEQFISANLGDAPKRINYKVAPSDLSTEVEFYSENEDIAYVDSSGQLNFVGGGDTVVHVTVHKNETEVLEQKINVHVEFSAQDILIDETIITALPQVQLSPASYPEDSTNKNFYFHISGDSASATVSSEGLVTFSGEQSTQVKIDIYANSDFSSVKKTVTVIYTAGQASDFTLKSDTLRLNCGERQNLEYEILPLGAVTKPTLSVVSSQPNVSEQSVVEIKDGEILAVNGGTAVVEASLALYDGKTIKHQCTVTVIREASQIEINLGLQKYNNDFVSANKAVTLSAQVFPRDASFQEITWSVDDTSKAVISDGQLLFNEIGTVVLTARCGSVTASVNVYYTGSFPLFAEVGAKIKGEEKEIPKSIMFGDSFDVYIKSIFPTEAENKTILLSTTNETTLSAAHVLTIDGTRVTATAGGTVTLVVNIANSVRATFEITVIKNPEQIVVSQADTQVTEETITLVAQVLPTDATIKNVEFTLDDTDIATLEGNVLHFSQNGTVYLHAHCADYDDLTSTFYIEKIEKDAILLSENTDSIDVHKGDVMTFDLSKQTYTSYELESGASEVVKVDGHYLKAVGVGQAKISCKLYSDQTLSKTIEVEVSVTALVEQIVLQNDFDFVSGEYVVASERVNLSFNVLPAEAENKQFKISLDASSATTGFIRGSEIYFISPGVVNVIVTSDDENCTQNFRLRYTGGDALSATLNIGDKVVLGVGESVTIDVENWIPKDTVNKSIFISDISTSINSVISINSRARSVTAISSGTGKILVEISNGISKEIEIEVVRKVSSIQIDSEIISAKEVITLDARALPATATNTTLAYSMDPCDFATLQNNVVTFTMPGQVTVLISATDGSGVTKEVTVKSTFGYYGKLVLSTQKKQLNKNETFNLTVSEKLPSDATGNINYKILSWTASDGSDNEVIKLEANGKITALYGGKATVRVYSLDYYNNEVYADCEIEVYVPVTSIDVTFSRKLDSYQNALITAQSELGFSYSVYPSDATIRTYSYRISNPLAAEIQDGKIIFKGGNRSNVTIEFVSDDNAQGQRSKSYTFYYFENDLVEATIDQSRISNGKIRLKAGENFSFTVLKAIPSDNKNLTFSIRNISERRNDSSKQVALFANGALQALNGGEYDFTLYLNNLNVGNFTLVVTREVASIEIEGETNVYISEPYYKITAKALPSDASQDEIAFRCSTPGVAISEAGDVTFTSYGKFEIVVYAKSTPSVTKSVFIEYTKQLRAIQFNETRDHMYVNDSVELTVIAQPYDADEFEYEMTVDKAEIAQLTKQSNGYYRLYGKTSGEVEVTAKVKNSEISVTKTFVFYDKIENIQLALDKTNDANGQGDYRYFANKFISGGKAVNTYQMNVSLKPATSPLSLLEWNTSAPSVATVDENGLVTFLKDGKVTIKVSQKSPYDGAKVASDSYEFTVVNGINVSSVADFMTARTLLAEQNKGLTDNFAALVLHSDIVFDSSQNLSGLVLDYNIYGNGHMLNFENVTQRSYRIITIKRNNIVLDNIVLRGSKLAANSALSTLHGTGSIVETAGCSNILFYNTIFENCDMGVNVLNSEVNFEGCIFRNGLSAGIEIRTTNSAKGCKVKVKDSAFSNILLCGVMFGFDNNTDPHQLILEGEVRFYNWTTLDELAAGLKAKFDEFLGLIDLGSVGDSAVNGLISQIKSIIERQTNYCYTYNGKDYYHIGVLGVKATLANRTFNANGKIDRSRLNSGCNYSDLECEGKANLAVTNVTFTIDVLSLAKTNPFIRPGDTYIGDTSVMAKIKQSSRF